MKKQPDVTSLNHLIIKDTPLGNIHCQANAVGLVSLTFHTEAGEFLEETILTDKLKILKEEIFAYFKGSKIGFSSAVDLTALSEFQREVLAVCREIPYGVVKTYGELAKIVGKPGAAQAVGGALAHNPVPLVIPCHRVISANGGLHGYSAAGGLKTKQTLLALEGVTFFQS